MMLAILIILFSISSSGVSQAHSLAYPYNSALVTTSTSTSTSTTTNAAISGSNRILTNHTSSTAACQCVIFRLDDVSDSFVRPSQLAVMDTFIQANQSLALGMIMNNLGNDSAIVNKIKEGQSKGLFELAIHGWNHVNYANMTEQDQAYTLNLAERKVQKIFGIPSHIFIPPFNTPNNATRDAMRATNLNILSASTNHDPFLYNALNPNSVPVDYGGSNNSPIYHMPEVTAFKYEENKLWSKIPISNIVGSAERAIQKYGYAVIMTHPQDYVVVEGGKFTSILDQAEINDLHQLINSFQERNIRIAKFSDVISSNIRTVQGGNATAMPEFPTPAAIAALGLGALLPYRRLHSE